MVGPSHCLSLSLYLAACSALHTEVVPLSFVSRITHYSLFDLPSTFAYLTLSDHGINILSCFLQRSTPKTQLSSEPTSFCVMKTHPAPHITCCAECANHQPKASNLEDGDESFLHRPRFPVHNHESSMPSLVEQPSYPLRMSILKLLYEVLEASFARQKIRDACVSRSLPWNPGCLYYGVGANVPRIADPVQCIVIRAYPGFLGQRQFVSTDREGLR
jgi:hypothetical protein